VGVRQERETAVQMEGGQAVSETPRTDRARLDEHDPAVSVASECSKLERELTAANRRISRLVQAGDCLLSHRNSTDYHEKLREWDKAKQDKP
jgi:3-deoxy-D-arabino-heptulosonate 7-phosphate (DAHP) synthase class II